ncbi:MAG: hypothetical protein H5T33_02240 [Candidatus Methanosuratus sp.]|nr:hypothetical protein [Candidatus Methanosuratincola sp.]
MKRSSEFISSLIRGGYSAERALSAARSLFGKDEIGFVAVDGTMAQDRRLDMIIFYAGAYAYRGGICLDRSGCKLTELIEETTSASVSSAIPIYEEQESSVAGEITEGGTEIDPDRLPSSLMRLSEYYLALKTLEDDPEIRLAILDRTLAGDFGHLVWSAREWLESGHSVLGGVDTPFGRVSEFDLEMARMLIPNEGLALPPSRSQFIRYAIVEYLLRAGRSVSKDELINAISKTGEKAVRIRRELDRLRSEYGMLEPGEECRLKPGAGSYWSRVFFAAKKVAEHVFNPPQGEHPLILSGEGEDRWICSNDLDLVSLFITQGLLRNAWGRGVLLVGLVKDTMAYELIRSVSNVLSKTGKLGSMGSVPDFNSDKAVLQNYSVIEAQRLNAPWRTIEYDACFRTVIPEDGKSNAGRGVRVKGAHKNVISNERTFVKAYLQLWQSSNDPAVRSHVFAYDRPCYPGLDSYGEFVLLHQDGDAEETIEPVLEFDSGSPVADLVMAILYSMAGEVIPEALGYNFPLFLADKKAKFVLEGARQTYLSTVAYELARSRLDQQILFNTRFRDFRSEIEAMRRG